MSTLTFLLSLAVLGYSVYSVIVYLSRRGDSKASLRQHRDDAEPLRSLSPEEQTALQPFLMHPGKPKRALSLAREGVFALCGPFVRHGITSSQGGETMHDTINGVEVILPYDAREFVDNYCEAEVVFCDRWAVVITIKGGFDLLSARERQRARQAQTQQWESGMPGTLGQAGHASGDRPGSAPQAGLVYSDQIEMLGQRDETPAEVAMRASPGVGWVPALILVTGLGGLGFASGMPPPLRTYVAAAAAALCAIALLLVWRKGAPPAPRRVNRVRGWLHSISLPVAGQLTQAPASLFLGDQLALKLPKHWRALVPPVSSAPVDLDVRVDDNSVLRYGGRLSIEEEVRRRSPVFWGRHVTLASVGLLAAIALFWASADLVRDVRLARAWVVHGAERSVTAPTELLASPPAVGSVITAVGQARCEPAVDVRPLPLEGCTRLRWGGAPPTAAALELDALTLALHQGEFLTARQDNAAEMLMQLRRAMAGGGSPGSSIYDHLERARAPKLLTRIGSSLKAVHAACPMEASSASLRDDAMGSACQALRDAFVAALEEAAEAPSIGWAGWLQRAQTGDLAQGDVEITVSSSAFSSLRAAGDQVADLRASEASSGFAEQIRQSAVGGVVMQVVAGEGSQLPQPPESAGGREGAFAALAQLEAVLADPGPHEFKVHGLVTRAVSGTGTPLLLEIDTSDPVPSLLRTGLLILALLMLAVHGCLLWRHGRAAAARRSEITSLNAHQLGRGTFGT